MKYKFKWVAGLQWRSSGRHDHEGTGLLTAKSDKEAIEKAITQVASRNGLDRDDVRIAEMFAIHHEVNIS